MAKEFSPEKSHEENVKVAIDKILGQETTLRKKKKSAEDHKRILFTKIVDNLILTEERGISIDEMFSLDLTEYNKSFLNIIEDFFSYAFNREQVNVINFYLYDRYCADGTVLDMVDSDGNMIPLESANDLWYLLKNLEK